MRRWMLWVIFFMVTAIQSGKAQTQVGPGQTGENLVVSEANIVGIWQQVVFRGNNEVVILPHIKVYSSDHTFNLIMLQKQNAAGITTTGTWSANAESVTENLDENCNNLFAGQSMQLPAKMVNKDVFTISYTHPVSNQQITEFWVRIPKFEREK